MVFGLETLAGQKDLGSAATLGAVLFAQSLAHAALCKAASAASPPSQKNATTD